MPRTSPGQRSVRRALAEQADPEKARLLQRFFKTRPGEYGQGDVFLGITVPTQRAIARQHVPLHLADLAALLRSKTHEHRFTALEILVMQYEQAKPATQQRLAHWYLQHLHGINNWDLVDTSAPYIVGPYTFQQSAEPLYTLAQSTNQWHRRIAVVSTLYWIGQHAYEPTLTLCELLLDDREPLIHKACGWTLREVGKKDRLVLLDFLDHYAPRMPRTMLRYAIERLTPTLRAKYLRAQ